MLRSSRRRTTGANSVLMGHGVTATPHLAKLLTAASMCLYAVAHFIPAIRISGGVGSPSQYVDDPGWVCLTVGIIWFPDSLANPFIFITWFRVLKNRRKALGLSFWALALAVGWIFYILLSLSTDALLFGGWLWLASIVLGVASTFFVWHTSTGQVTRVTGQCRLRPNQVCAERWASGFV